MSTIAMATLLSTEIGVIAGGHDTYRVAVGIQHLIPVTGYCAVMDLQSHELAFKPFGFLCHKSVAAL